MVAKFLLPAWPRKPSGWEFNVQWPQHGNPQAKSRIPWKNRGQFRLTANAPLHLPSETVSFPGEVSSHRWKTVVRCGGNTGPELTYWAPFPPQDASLPHSFGSFHIIPLSLRTVLMAPCCCFQSVPLYFDTVCELPSQPAASPHLPATALSRGVPLSCVAL